MNLLAIDYGTKRIGLAISVMQIITPIPAILNDKNTHDQIQKIVKDYRIEKIFIGISEGKFASKTKIFAHQLSNMLQLPIETVEEAVSTIEAGQIFLENNKKGKDYDRLIDSIAAAVILRRAIN